MKRLLQSLNRNIYVDDIIHIDSKQLVSGIFTVNRIDKDGYLSITGEYGSYIHNGHGMTKMRWETFKKEWNLWPS